MSVRLTKRQRLARRARAQRYGLDGANLEAAKPMSGLPQVLSYASAWKIMALGIPPMRGKRNTPWEWDYREHLRAIRTAGRVVSI